VCITDAMEMKGATQGRTPFESASLALEAGCDLLLFAEFGDALRTLRHQLAKALADGSLPRAGFDAARPRLAALDRRVAEPSATELATPLGQLTPPDWKERLTAIAERGVRLHGTLPADAAAGPWRVTEPPWPYGETLGQMLGRLGKAGSEVDGGASLEVVAVASRAPLPPAEVERLRQLGMRLPTALVAFQNDAFLDLLPEATLRISAPDPTPLTRQVVARMLVRRARQVARV
jgi:hypothetical protein